MGIGRKWKLRAELVWPDVDTRVKLPPGWGWLPGAAEIVNADGHAADPERQLNLRGGVLGTPWASGPHELAGMAEVMWNKLQPGHNYRTSLRIGVRIDGLDEDLGACQRIASYSRTYLPGLWPAIDPLDQLTAGQTDQKGVMAAQVRLHQVMRDRHHLVAQGRHDMRMKTSSVRLFVAATYPVLRRVHPSRHVHQREAVSLMDATANLVQLRCFAGPTDAGQVYAAAAFSCQWLAAALNGGQPLPVVRAWSGELPRQVSFDPELEMGWSWTNVVTNRRDVVAARLASGQWWSDQRT